MAITYDWEDSGNESVDCIACGKQTSGQCTSDSPKEVKAQSLCLDCFQAFVKDQMQKKKVTVH